MHINMHTFLSIGRGSTNEQQVKNMHKYYKYYINYL